MLRCRHYFLRSSAWGRCAGRSQARQPFRGPAKGQHVDRPLVVVDRMMLTGSLGGSAMRDDDLADSPTQLGPGADRGVRPG